MRTTACVMVGSSRHRDFFSPNGGRHTTLELAETRPRILYKPWYLPIVLAATQRLSASSVVVFASTIMVLSRFSVFALMLAGLVHAAAVKRQAVTPLTSSQIASYAQLTYFASTAYCDASTTINWSCGGATLATCSADPLS
jgi:hypothetical protein